MDTRNQFPYGNGPQDNGGETSEVRYSKNTRPSGRATAGRKSVSGTRTRRRKPVKRSLAMEYLRHWYVILISMMTCVPAYMMEIFLANFFIARNVPPFVAALITMFIGGLIATLPLLALNIYLVVKRKKYYAIAIQIILMELLGIVFYLWNQISIALIR